ncbi:DUF624 domain-containing protein [Brachybacterium sp. YJGR34]|uniref:DUF624 domain-containing protein n=1 Tax=Brachybacterium sp. YJGR34 TaxID=2059911 RepID=UPI00130023D7|nr:DUF624 domain-containing protein [Brachybacterium sp. YJGR34]
MNASRSPSGPAQVPSWVLRGNEMIERVVLVLRINLVWIALTLLGLVVLGVAPASVAAADALLAAREGRRVRVLASMWSTYRRQLAPATIRVLPLMAVQAGATSMLWLVIGGAVPSAPLAVALGTVAAISGAWATVSAAAIVATPRLRRQDVLVTWRLALLLPGVLPARAVGLLLGLLVWAMLCALLWPLAILVGAAAAIDLATGLLTRRIEHLLQEIDAAGQERP